jgi:hypothetical protein
VSGSKNMDLVRSVCAGAGNRFGETVCEYYVRLTAECDLLIQAKMETIFEKGRCNPYNILKSAVKKNLIKYMNLLGVKDPNDLQKYILSIIYPLSHRLKDIRLKKGHNLAVLIGYIKKASYTEVILYLQSEGLLEKKMCGSCKFLSELKPYICLRENIDAQNNGVTLLKDNPFYQKKRSKTDKCQEGFQSRIFKSVDEYTNYDSKDGHKLIPEKLKNNGIEDKSLNRIEIEKINQILKKRAINTKHKNTKKIYKRQYNVFINLYSYIFEGYSIRKAIQLIAIKIGKNVKTIERDINDIRTFLKKKISYN